MPFDDGDNLEDIRLHIAKEDHVAGDDEGPQPRCDLASRTADRPGSAESFRHFARIRSTERRPTFRLPASLLT